MLQARPHFAELSRLFERQLIAERGLEVIAKYYTNGSVPTVSDQKALKAIDKLFNELLEGERILTGHNVTNTMIDASLALQEVISMTRDHRPVQDFLNELKMMKNTVNTILEGHKPASSEKKALLTFLTSLAETIGQELEESTTGRSIVPF